jgi:hypothetical protein
MEMRSASVKFIFILILILTFNLLTCENQKILARGKIDFLPDSIVQQPEQLPGEDHSSWDIGVDSLLKLIEIKNEEFKALEQKLTQKSIELTEKEQEFVKIEADLRTIHDKSSLLFFIGLGLFIGGCVFFLATRKSVSKKINSSLKR